MHVVSIRSVFSPCIVIFFFNDTATTEIYTLSLHDALPIWRQLFAPNQDRTKGLDRSAGQGDAQDSDPERRHEDRPLRPRDRKSTRLNSSHANISYAVFCLKKKKTNNSSLLIQ